MNAVIIFESLVIPAIITFMIIALFIIEKDNFFRKKSGIYSKKNKNNQSGNSQESHYWNKNQLPNEKYNHLDFSGGNWGI
jgi:hypothetical protein